MTLVNFLQNKLDEIAPNSYVVSNERNIDSDYSKNEVVVSALSGPIYKDSSTIPYQIDITTKDIDSVMLDFTMIAKTCNNEPYTEVVGSGDEYTSETIVPFFNSPVVMEKDLVIGSNHYARITVFGTINTTTNVNNVKTISIDGEEIEKLNASYVYAVEANANRTSGTELTKSKKKTSSSSLTFDAVNKSSVFLNKVFKISTGQLPGNTSFSVTLTLDNGMTATLLMFITSYTLSTERAKLPAAHIGMSLYDNRGETNA